VPVQGNYSEALPAQARLLHFLSRLVLAVLRLQYSFKLDHPSTMSEFLCCNRIPAQVYVYAVLKKTLY